MNIDLARRFMLQYVPADGQSQVNDIWNFMKTNPEQLLQNAIVFVQMEFIRSNEPKVSQAAASAFTAGFALAYCLKFPEVERLLTEACERHEKALGANVENFLAHKKVLRQ